MTDEERARLLDDEHLRLLRIGYFIAAGANAIWIVIGLFYMLGGLVFLRIPMNGGPHNEPPPPEFVRWIFLIVGALVTTFGVILSSLKFLVAQRLRDRRSRVFCMVIAALCCLAIPYGTALGVLTLMVLNRPSVMAQFQQG